MELWEALRIKNARKSQDLTQKQLCELLGIPLRTLEDWESGRNKPPIYVVRLIEFRLRHLY